MQPVTRPCHRIESVYKELEQHSSISAYAEELLRNNEPISCSSQMYKVLLEKCKAIQDRNLYARMLTFFRSSMPLPQKSTLYSNLVTFSTTKKNCPYELLVQHNYFHGMLSNSFQESYKCKSLNLSLSKEAETVFVEYIFTLRIPKKLLPKVCVELIFFAHKIMEQDLFEKLCQQFLDFDEEVAFDDETVKALLLVFKDMQSTALEKSLLLFLRDRVSLPRDQCYYRNIKKISVDGKEFFYPAVFCLNNQETVVHSRVYLDLLFKRKTTSKNVQEMLSLLQNSNHLLDDTCRWNLVDRLLDFPLSPAQKSSLIESLHTCLHFPVKKSFQGTKYCFSPQKVLKQFSKRLYAFLDTVVEHLDFDKRTHEVLPKPVWVFSNITHISVMYKVHPIDLPFIKELQALYPNATIRPRCNFAHVGAKDVGYTYATCLWYLEKPEAEGFLRRLIESEKSLLAMIVYDAFASLMAKKDALSSSDVRILEIASKKGSQKATAILNKQQAYLEKGNEFLRDKKFADAIAEFEKAIKMGFEGAQCFYECGLYYRNSDEKKAIAYLEKAIEVDDKFLKPYQLLGTLLWKNGQREKLHLWLDRIKKYRHRVPVAGEIAKVLAVPGGNLEGSFEAREDEQKGKKCTDKKRALFHFEQAIEKGSLNPFVFYQAALLVDNKEQKIEYLEFTLALDPHYMDAYEPLTVLCWEGNKKEKLDMLRQYVEEKQVAGVEKLLQVLTID